MNTTTTGYENAPSTLMLASHCAACSKPLRDADSVQAGMGPDCREKYGRVAVLGLINVEAAKEALASVELGAMLMVRDDGTVDVHASANKLIHHIACLQDGEKACACIIALWHIGYTEAAERCAKRVGSISIAPHPQQPDHYVLRAPYSEAFFSAMRLHGVYGTYDKANKCRLIPVKYRKQLWRCLVDAFPGHIAIGVKGPVYLANGDEPVGPPPQRLRDLPSARRMAG